MSAYICQQPTHKTSINVTFYYMGRKKREMKQLIRERGHIQSFIFTYTSINTLSLCIPHSIATLRVIKLSYIVYNRYKSISDYWGKAKFRLAFLRTPIIYIDQGHHKLFQRVQHLPRIRLHSILDIHYPVD